MVVVPAARSKPSGLSDRGDPDAPTTRTAPREAFPVLAWSGVPEEHTTVERYRELANAGFTHSFSSASSADKPQECSNYFRHRGYAATPS